MTARDQDPVGWIVARLESGFLSTLFLTLVVLGLIRLGLTTLSFPAWSWIDEAMHAVLLWLTMLGAVVAAGRLQTLRVRFLEARLGDAVRQRFQRFIWFASAGFCLVMAWHSLQLVALEHEFRQFALPGVPAWVVLLVIPAGFGLMAARFAGWGLMPGAARSNRR